MWFHTYTLDLCGEEAAYKGAKKAYRAGQRVVLYYTNFATDTDFTFLLDGKPLNTPYREGKGYRVAFRMPARHARLKLYTRCSMVRGIAPDLMQVDYYTTSVATVEGDGHYELVLSSTEDRRQARLERYIKEDEEAGEIQTAYLVPFEAVDRVMNYINIHHLFAWNELVDGLSLEGERTVLKFWDGSRHIRVSTDCMPENGKAILEEIGRIIKEYLKDEYRVE